MNLMRSTSDANRAVGDDVAGPASLVTPLAPGGQGRARHRWGARLRVALMLVLVLSLFPAPLIVPAAAQAPDDVTIPEPPA